jgi:hypothetical protein
MGDGDALMMQKRAKRRWLRASPKRVALALLGLGCISAVAAMAAQKADIATLTPQEVQIAARPVSFDPAAPSHRSFGRLEWRGGFTLSSAHEVFGGYSGLAVSADGNALLAVSDAGSWLTAKLDYKDGSLAGVSGARLGPLTQKNGAPIQRRRDRDAETLIALKPGGLERRYYVGFEGRHRLEEYTFKDGAFEGPLRRAELPKNLRSMRGNSGLEAATMLRGGPHAGALVLFAERKLGGGGDHTGALVRGGKSHALSLKRTGEFDVTELASLADGSLLMLERSFIRSSLKLDIRLRLIPAEQIEPGARLEGETLLETGTRYTIDNFEAMDVLETKDGETLIFLMSDDNFNFFQKTLLVVFALKKD